MSDSSTSNAAFSVSLLSGLIAGACLLGVVLCFPFFSYLPFFWGGGLAIAFVLYFGVSVALWRRVAPFGYFVVGLGYTVLFAWSITTYCGVERLEHYECAWRSNADWIEVNLSPAGGFSWSRVSSSELRERLQKDQPVKVHVELPITRDFGSVRARGMIRRVEGIPVREP